MPNVFSGDYEAAASEAARRNREEPVEGFLWLAEPDISLTQPPETVAVIETWTVVVLDLSALPPVENLR